MAFANSKFNSKQALKVMLVGVGALLFLNPSAKAAQLGASDSGVYGDRAMVLAAAPNDCLNDIAEGFTAETRNYYAGICYTGNGTYYVGHSKNGNGSILLRVSSPRRNVYVARNGRYTYTLDMNRNQLTIKLPNGRQIVEKVIRVIDS
ncbi:hypothetical protein [Aerosakkonema funiforme]|uniref:Uncharacterized protein n=1 Tax=Aerosakkonema funiforme FACHB-1375 TaxID=2949571 RepID=A0A926VKD0_9CYAN|nr:hypothetical protein [Aerosakkonema funiforme]MBD2185308.1 hypothetical protein [Aerosakkonema funiforme FACHB-1375]